MVGVASIETIMSQKTNEAEQPSKTESENISLFQSGIEIKNLTYRYPGSDTPVLKDISFMIKPNQTIGILGQIGAGKTTLVNCINRYLKVPNGVIFLDGIDINELSLSDIRQTIRTVSQDVFLFSDSIRNNILFGAVNEASVSEASLQRVIEESALSDEIDRFPYKLETTIGEKGIMLSGGQKQRISLARSMIAPFDLLILDNILSAVDFETERFLLTKILARRTSRSLLIVSHRVQALEHADLILVLDKGTIVDRGTHQQLIQKEGLYKQIWQLQEQ